MEEHPEKPESPRTTNLFIMLSFLLASSPSQHYRQSSPLKDAFQIVAANLLALACDSCYAFERCRTAKAADLLYSWFFLRLSHTVPLIKGCSISGRGVYQNNQNHDKSINEEKILIFLIPVILLTLLSFYYCSCFFLMVIPVTIVSITHYYYTLHYCRYC